MYNKGCRCSPCVIADNDYHRPRQTRYNKIRRTSGKALLARLKAKPCLDCEGVFPVECMDFDHVRGTKMFNIGTYASQHGKLTPQLKDELAKCELVCANCHRIRTQARR